MASIPDHVLVLGLARSGKAAVMAIRRQGATVTAHDTNAGLDVTEVEGDIHLGAWDDRFLDEVGLVVKSPGIPADRLPVTARSPARSRHLGGRARSTAAREPDLGMTGTNGKTTTAALLGAMFDAAGVPAEVAGNRLSADEPRRDDGAGRRGSSASSDRSSSRTSRRFTAGSRCSSISSRSSRPPWLVRHVPRREAADVSRTRSPMTSPSSHAVSEQSQVGRAGSSSAVTTPCRPSR